jgi:hypothetical protein
LGKDGLVIPWIVRVILLLIGMVREEVAITIVMVLELTEQVAEETAKLKIDAEHTGVPIVKSVGKVIFIAGLLPRVCPSRKLNVKMEAAIIEVEDRDSEALELLNVEAVAVTVALRCKISNELRFQMKDKIVGV